jgi:hypothetical protein
MANKEFKIQSDTISLNGVPLSSSADGKVVLPGVTRATNFVVKEVDDVEGDEGSPSFNAETVMVIDHAQWNFYAGITSSSPQYVAAQYTVELDDGEIDEIDVDVQGLFSDADRSLARGGLMWATDVPNATDNFNINDWTQIPFLPKFQASSVESDLGGGGSNSPVQPYLELTDTPFITQPAVLGTPVTVTAAPQGVGAQVVITITEGSVLDSITIFEPGTGYVEGQQYKVYYYQIGGSDDSSSLTLTIDTVDESGGILTIADAAFVGTPTNTTNVYVTALNYQASVFDEIDTGLTLTRDVNQGIYNVEAETEYDNNTYLSPLGTEWNSDGWGNLLELGTRTYTTWRGALGGQVGNNIIGSELVMHDSINDKYYKFEFTNWGGNNGSYSYTRTLVTDPNYFRKDDNATANNVDVIEDDSTLQIGITRGVQNGIYNPFTEEGWDSDVSPQGTLWNIAGWDDLTDVETRTYTNFYAAYNGQLGNRVPGSKAVMYVPSIEKYYAIEWLSWTQNANGGGFSYYRREIDLDKLQQGITFADGTVQTTAYVATNVVSTAPGLRRIETASGYNQVSVTQRLTNNYTGAISQTTNGYELRVARTLELDAVIIPLNESNTDETYDLSFDNVTFREVWLSSIQQNEYWFYYQNDLGQTTPQTQGDPVYLRITTGGDSVAWWDKSNLPGGAADFRGAVIDYHAFTDEATIIGTIHIVDDDGEEHITHTEVSSGNDDSMNDNLWIVTNEGTIRYARFDGEAKTLKIHWTAKVFYGDETND